MLKDKLAAARLLPDGTPLKAGTRLVQADYGEALRLIAQQGETALHGGPLGDLLVECMQKAGGFVCQKDLTDYRVIERAPIRGRYRDWEIVGPPPPAASGVHITQMLNILEGYDIKRLGFGTVDTLHLLAEVLKIAFADRAQASGDPAFVDVPVERITSKAYADQRRADIDLGRARHWTSGLLAKEGADTTHLTVADGKGNVVATTQTINSLFGARFIVPGHRHGAQQLHVELRSAAGQCAVDRAGQARDDVDGADDGAARRPAGLCAGPARRPQDLPLGLAGADQPVDHGMALQEAVEAPRIWTEGAVLEVEHGIPETVRQGLSARGHKLQVMPTVAGGMNAIQFHDDGSMTGAACWRADGSPVALGGGLARPGVRFVLPG